MFSKQQTTAQSSSTEADTAIKALDGQRVVLPQTNPLQVRYAESTPTANTGAAILYIFSNPEKRVLSTLYVFLLFFSVDITAFRFDIGIPCFFCLACVRQML